MPLRFLNSQNTVPLITSDKVNLALQLSKYLSRCSDRSNGSLWLVYLLAYAVWLLFIGGMTPFTKGLTPLGGEKPSGNSGI